MLIFRSEIMDLILVGGKGLITWLRFLLFSERRRPVEIVKGG